MINARVVQQLQQPIGNLNRMRWKKNALFKKSKIGILISNE